MSISESADQKLTIPSGLILIHSFIQTERERREREEREEREGGREGGWVGR